MKIMCMIKGHKVAKGAGKGFTYCRRCHESLTLPDDFCLLRDLGYNLSMNGSLNSASVSRTAHWNVETQNYCGDKDARYIVEWIRLDGRLRRNLYSELSHAREQAMHLRNLGRWNSGVLWLWKRK